MAQGRPRRLKIFLQAKDRGGVGKSILGLHKVLFSCTFFLRVNILSFVSHRISVLAM